MSLVHISMNHSPGIIIPNAVSERISEESRSDLQNFRQSFFVLSVRTGRKAVVDNQCVACGGGCFVWESTGENYEASDADKALEKLVGVKQEVLDDLCNMIRDGGSDYYKQAGELLQKVLKKDKIWRWSIDKMLESSFVKGGATVTSKLPLMDLVKNVNNCSGKLVLRNELSSTGHRTPNPNCPFFLSSLQF